MCFCFTASAERPFKLTPPPPNNLSVWHKPDRHRLASAAVLWCSGVRFCHPQRAPRFPFQREGSRAALQRKRPTDINSLWPTLLWQPFTLWHAGSFTPRHTYLFFFFFFPPLTPWYSDHWKNVTANAISKDAKGSWETWKIYVFLMVGVKHLIACLIYCRTFCLRWSMLHIAKGHDSQEGTSVFLRNFLHSVCRNQNNLYIHKVQQTLGSSQQKCSRDIFTGGMWYNFMNECLILTEWEIASAPRSGGTLHPHIRCPLHP